MEIFKVFSSLNLSKARFDSLLDWLKNLKLEEGKQGMYLTGHNCVSCCDCRMIDVCTGRSGEKKRMIEKGKG